VPRGGQRQLRGAELVDRVGQGALGGESVGEVQNLADVAGDEDAELVQEGDDAVCADEAGSVADGGISVFWVGPGRGVGCAGRGGHGMPGRCRRGDGHARGVGSAASPRAAPGFDQCTEALRRGVVVGEEGCCYHCEHGDCDDGCGPGEAGVECGGGHGAAGQHRGRQSRQFQAEIGQVQACGDGNQVCNVCADLIRALAEGT
jgi:hypothetical protein